MLYTEDISPNLKEVHKEWGPQLMNPMFGFMEKGVSGFLDSYSAIWEKGITVW